MNYFLKKLLVFIIPFVLLVFMASAGFKIYMQNPAFFKINPASTQIILGHSQTECGMNDSLIANTRNFSQGGESYFYTYLKLQKLLESNPTITTAFICYSNNQIDARMNKWIWESKSMFNSLSRYSFMLSPEDYKILIKNNPETFLKSEIRGIRNSMNFVFKTNKDYLHDRNWGGYMYLKRNKVDSLLASSYMVENKKYKFDTLSPININYLKKIVTLCKAKNIKTYFIRTPLHPELPFLKNEKKFLAIKNKHFEEIPFLDFKNFPITNDEFGDFDHLNYKGAKKFSFFFNQLLHEGLLDKKNKQEFIDLAMVGKKSN